MPLDMPIHGAFFSSSPRSASAKGVAGLTEPTVILPNSTRGLRQTLTEHEGENWISKWPQCGLIELCLKKHLLITLQPFCSLLTRTVPFQIIHEMEQQKKQSATGAPSGQATASSRVHSRRARLRENQDDSGLVVRGPLFSPQMADSGHGIGVCETSLVHPTSSLCALSSFRSPRATPRRSMIACPTRRSSSAGARRLTIFRTCSSHGPMSLGPGSKLRETVARPYPSRRASINHNISFFLYAQLALCASSHLRPDGLHVRPVTKQPGHDEQSRHHYRQPGEDEQRRKVHATGRGRLPAHQYICVSLRAEITSAILVFLLTKP